MVHGPVLGPSANLHLQVEARVAIVCGVAARLRRPAPAEEASESRAVITTLKAEKDKCQHQAPRYQRHGAARPGSLDARR